MTAEPLVSSTLRSAARTTTTTRCATRDTKHGTP